MIRSRVLPLLEEAVTLDNLATSVKVSETQLPELHALLVEAAEILDLPNVPVLSPPGYLPAFPDTSAIKRWTMLI